MPLDQQVHLAVAVLLFLPYVYHAALWAGDNERPSNAERIFWGLFVGSILAMFWPLVVSFHALVLLGRGVNNLPDIGEWHKQREEHKEQKKQRARALKAIKELALAPGVVAPPGALTVADTRGGELSLAGVEVFIVCREGEDPPVYTVHSNRHEAEKEYAQLRYEVNGRRLHLLQRTVQL